MGIEIYFKGSPFLDSKSVLGSKKSFRLGPELQACKHEHFLKLFLGFLL